MDMEKNLNTYSSSFRNAPTEYLGKKFLNPIPDWVMVVSQLMSFINVRLVTEVSNGSALRP